MLLHVSLVCSMRLSHSVSDNYFAVTDNRTTRQTILLTCMHLLSSVCSRFTVVDPCTPATIDTRFTSLSQLLLEWVSAARSELAKDDAARRHPWKYVRMTPKDPPVTR